MAPSPVNITCPSCGGGLKLNHQVPDGKKLRCPKCNHSFQASGKAVRSKQGTREAAKPQRKPVPQPVAESKSGMSPLLLGIIAVLILALGITGGMLVAGNRGDDNTDQQADASKASSDSEPEKSGNDSKTVEPGKTDEPKKAEKQPESKSQTIPSTGNSDSKAASKSPDSSGSDPSSDPTGQPEVEDSKSPADKQPTTAEDDDPNRPKSNEFEAKELPPAFAVDPDRPKENKMPFNEEDAKRPIGGLAGLPRLFQNRRVGQVAIRPIIIVREVRPPAPPTPKPAAKQSGAKQTAAKGKPAISVNITPVLTGSTTLVVDHQANPGLSGQINVTLSGTPTSPVTVAIAPGNGLNVSQSSLTFPANVAPTNQTLTVSGNATANLGQIQSRVVNVTMTASGTGLTAGGSVNIPVQVVRRNRFVTAIGVTFSRGDVVGNGNPAAWFAFLTTSPLSPVVPFATASTPTNTYYTNGFVQVVLAGPVGSLPAGTRVRLAPQVVAETSPGSGTFAPFPLLNGVWQ